MDATVNRATEGAPKGAQRLQVGVRVRSEFDRRLGTVESFDAEFLPEWPWGVRWGDGSYEVCSSSELAVVETMSFDAAEGEGRR